MQFSEQGPKSGSLRKPQSLREEAQSDSNDEQAFERLEQELGFKKGQRPEDAQPCLKKEDWNSEESDFLGGKQSESELRSAQEALRNAQKDERAQKSFDWNFRKVESSENTRSNLKKPESPNELPIMQSRELEKSEEMDSTQQTFYYTLGRPIALDPDIAKDLLDHIYE